MIATMFCTWFLALREERPLVSVRRDCGSKVSPEEHSVCVCGVQENPDATFVSHLIWRRCCGRQYVLKGTRFGRTEVFLHRHHKPDEAAVYA